MDTNIRSILCGLVFIVVQSLCGMQPGPSVQNNTTGTETGIDNDNIIKWIPVCAMYAKDTLFVAGFCEKTIILLRITKNKQEYGLLTGHEGKVTSLLFNEDEKKPLLISGDNKGEVIIWDACTGKLLKRKVHKSKYSIEQAFLSPDNSKLAVIAHNWKPVAFKIDWKDQPCFCNVPILSDPIELQHGDAFCGIFDSSGNNLLIGDFNGEIVHEPLAVESEIYSITTVEDPNFGVCYFVRSKNGSVAAATEHGQIILLRPDQESFEAMAILQEYKNKKTAFCMSFSSDGNLLFSGDADGLLMVWDVKKAKLLKKILMKNGVCIRCLVVSDDRLFVVLENGSFNEFSIKKLLEEVGVSSPNVKKRKRDEIDEK